MSSLGQPIQWRQQPSPWTRSAIESPDNQTKWHLKRFDASMLGAIIKHRFAQNRDIKIVLESHAYTGVGKTTAGRLLCEAIDPRWDVDKHATLDANEYIKMYDQVAPYSCILFDEFEREADSRRSNTHENVETFKKLQTARYRNIATVMTMPYTAAVDKRTPQLADIIIQAERKGTASIWYLYKKSYIQNSQARLKIYPVRLRTPDGKYEFLQWQKREDEAIRKLEDMKEEADRGQLAGVRRITEEELETERRKARKEGHQETRKGLVKKFAEEGYLEIEKQEDLAELVGVHRATISRDKQDLVEQGELEG